jgi:hypothetical protein
MKERNPHIHLILAIHLFKLFYEELILIAISDIIRSEESRIRRSVCEGALLAPYAVGLGESSRSFAYKIAEKATGRHISENVLFGYYSGEDSPFTPPRHGRSNRVLLRSLFKVD